MCGVDPIYILPKEGKTAIFKDIDLNEAFSIFKRFEVVIGTDVNDIEVNEDDYLDLL